MAREMKDSGVAWIGEVPADWSLIRMKNCIKKRDGGAWGEDATGEDGDIICLRIADFDYARFRFKPTAPEQLTKRRYSQDVIQKLSLAKNDILIEKSGGGEKTPVGRSVIFDKDYPALFANFMDRLRCKEFVDPEFMQFIFATFYKNDYSKNYIKQTTGIQNLDLTSMLANELVAIPNLEEQKEIVANLNQKCAEIDAVLEKTRTSIDEYKKLKQAIITQAVTKGVRRDRSMKESGIEQIPKIPEDWDVVSLKKCIDILPGYAFSSQDFDSGDGIPLLRGINVGINEIRWENVVYWNKPLDDTLKVFRLEENDIVVGLDRPWIAGGMRVAFVRGDDLPCLLLQRVCRIRPDANIDRRLIYYWISSDIFKETLSNKTTGVSVPHISTKQIEQFVIAIPPNQEDRDICDYLDKQCEKIDSIIQKKERFLTELETYKKSLIYEYVTGKKEVENEF